MKTLAKRIIRRYDCKTAFFHKLPHSARVLDLGCGSGVNGIALKAIQPSIELHGVDILAETTVPGIYSYITVDLDDGVLPFPDEYFDAILFTHVIEHLRTPLQLGKEINRIMKKGGMVYVETPNWTSLLVPSFGFHREQHSPFNFFDDPTHLKPWSKHGLFEFLYQSCNLHVMKVGNTRNWLRVPTDIIVILYGLLTANRSYAVMSFWNLYGWCIYGLGRKT
jgi:ubiquinone/menaquinone biosynthesis C-methylase UbiE